MSEPEVREREFTRSLVELLTAESPRQAADRALAWLVASTGAREVYVALRGAGALDALTWEASHGCEPARAERIAAEVSRGILAEAIARGETVVTASARDDVRFEHLESVREHQIEAVLCAPIGSERPIGVVYVRGQAGASAYVPFSDLARERIELFARAMGPVAELLARRQEASSIPDATGGPFGDLVAGSPPMRALVARLAMVAPLDVHVLLTGASGTGKSRLAEAIHRASPRASGPFVAVNCGALPAGLVENELFGAEPGAHSTTPRGGVRGKVDSARGGTLFLDEVAELPLPAQAALLRLTQDKVFHRLGASQPTRADVRLIAATNVSLPDAVAAKRFREDLYYRLKVFEARVPTLGERAEDVPALAMHVLDEVVRRHDFQPMHLSLAAKGALAGREFPGNVRELAHVIESAALEARLRGSERVEVRDLFPADDTGGAESATLADATRRFQREHVAAVLRAHDWNVAEAARTLDVARSYLYTLIRGFGLRREDGTSGVSARSGRSAS